MLIEKGRLLPGMLAGKVAIVTGAGRGIGLESARALIWLGAKVVVAEVDRRSGLEAERKLSCEFGRDHAQFIRTDVAADRSLVALRNLCVSRFGRIDVVLNNATITPMGAVSERSTRDWDKSYRVNLRGPVLLAQLCIPGMVQRRYGVVAFVSSVGLAYMGAYETFKAAQLHLAETLDAELEGSGVFSFAIGPGLVHTPGSLAGINELAPRYGKTVEEFYAMSADQIISAEAAGTGIAAAIALAESFHGQNTSSRQALSVAGIDLPGRAEAADSSHLTEEGRSSAIELCRKVLKTLSAQSAGWQERPLFERQWMHRDFRKTAGMPVEMWIDQISRLRGDLETGRKASELRMPPLHQLIAYYSHLGRLHADYEKDPGLGAKQAAIIQSWQKDVEGLKAVVDA